MPAPREYSAALEHVETNALAASDILGQCETLINTPEFVRSNRQYIPLIGRIIQAAVGIRRRSIAERQRIQDTYTAAREQASEASSEEEEDHDQS